MPVVTKRYGEILVARDDLIEGGSKLRFLPLITGGAKEIVYGSPFCGGAQLALACMGRVTGQKITIFAAKRAQLHRRQIAALDHGAEFLMLSPGYMTQVQAKAKAYAEKTGAMMLPLGFDVPEAIEPFVKRLKEFAGTLPDRPTEVWCATGSGFLAKCLGRAFPDSQVIGVAVGLRSKHEAQAMPANVKLVPHPLDFAAELKETAPFPSCPNYDRKAWSLCQSQGKGRRLFWNVMS